MKCIVIVVLMCISQLICAHATHVTTEFARKATISDHTEALGTLRANESVELTVNVTETITAIHFEDGQNVDENEILVEMTNAEENALLIEAKTNVDEAKRQLDRVKELVKQNTASKSLQDELQRNYDAAQARLVATQSRLKDRIVAAPFAGRLGLRNISLGTLLQPGDVITTLTDSSRMKLDFEIPALLLPELKIGLPIKATTRAYKDEEFNGDIVSIDNQIDPITRTLRVRAILPNEQQLLKQGMLMHINLYFNQRESLLVSEQSLLPESDKNYVLVVVEKDDITTTEKREINIGERRLGEVEVLSGIRENDQIVSHGAFKTKPGKPIVIDHTD